ncbi:MAG: biotin--[acetyl-CoA-carboxylase] ligase [Bacillota bacterium]
MELVLKILKENRGQFVSGESLARLSGITRAGIWKQINRLRRNGYLIESSPRKGYRLLTSTPGLYPLELKDGLDTKVFGQIVYEDTEVDSTNNWARSLANRGALEGTLVIAESQTAGRGRMGRQWASASGQGLWFSLVLRPRISAPVLGGLTLLAAVIMAQTIQSVTGIQPQIKWPNDLIHNGRKLGGILAEMSGEMDLVNYLILGIGINVNHRPEDFPPELRGRAVSLQMIQPGNLSRKTLLQEFLRRFETAYYALPETGIAEAVRYAKLHSATVGKPVRINRGFGKVLEGEALDLETDGSLIVKETNGRIVRVFSGDSE